MSDTVIREVCCPHRSARHHSYRVALGYKRHLDLRSSPGRELVELTLCLPLLMFHVNRPFARMGMFPMGGRSTAIKLKEG